MTSSGILVGHLMAKHPEQKWQIFFAAIAAIFIVEGIKGGLFTEIIPGLFKALWYWFVDKVTPSPLDMLDKHISDLKENQKKIADAKAKLDALNHPRAFELSNKLSTIKGDMDDKIKQMESTRKNFSPFF